MTLQNDFLRLEINPEVGASIAAFEAKIAGQWVALMRPTPRPLPDKSSPYASFTLAPFSNRLKDAQFRFEGSTYQLKPSSPDGGTQHGDVRNRPWQVKEQGDGLICKFDSQEFPDFNWPWSLGMVVNYRLEGNVLLVEMKLSSTSGSAMPAGFGIHPYFVQNLLDSPDALLRFEAKGWYATDQSLIPQQAMEPIPAHLDFSSPRSPKQQDLNEVYGGYGGWAELTWPGVAKLRMESDPIFEHFVLYTPPDGSVALEPVTNVTDGFNLFARGVKGTGVVVLKPGQSMKGSIRMAVDFLD